MGYYSKEDYVLLRDEPGATDGSLEVWETTAQKWGVYPYLKRHLAQNVLVPISYKQAEALKKDGGGPRQPAAALTGKKKG